MQIERLKQIGDWLNINGEAIYNTRVIQEFNDNKVFFTKGQNSTYFALVRVIENQSPEGIISWTGNLPKTGSKISLLNELVNLKWELRDNLVQVYLPKKVLEKYKSWPDLALKFEK